jgi:hypothetical protein
LERLHERFLALLPRIQLHAQIYFRSVRCPDKREDCVAETVGLAYQWFVRLAQRGKDAAQFPAALASLAARAVRSGRRLCGQERARDALSALAQQRHGFTVGKLPDFSTLHGTPIEEALRDNARTPPPEAAAFRCDFPAWLATLSDRDRRLVQDMAQGERTQRLARKYRLSPARISQKRRAYHADWKQFHGEA